MNKLKFKQWRDESVDESPVGWAEWLRSSWLRWPPGCRWAEGSVGGSGCWVAAPQCTQWWWSSWRDKVHTSLFIVVVFFTMLCAKKKKKVLCSVLGGEWVIGEVWKKKKYPQGWFIIELSCSCCPTDRFMVTAGCACHIYSGTVWVWGDWNFGHCGNSCSFKQKAH